MSNLKNKLIIIKNNLKMNIKNNIELFYIIIKN